MLSRFKKSITKTKTTSPFDVFGGVLIGIIGAYLFVYAPDLLWGEHVFDPTFLSQLSLLGMLIVGFGYWETECNK